MMESILSTSDLSTIVGMKTGHTWALGMKQSWGFSLQVVNKQPKTHSGKTVRHLLRDTCGIKA